MRFWNKQKAQKEREQLIAVQEKVRDMLHTEGWQIAENKLKKELSELYKGFLDVKEKDLKYHQDRVNLMRNFIDKIYSYADLHWTWDGYRDLRVQTTDERTPEEKDLEKYQEIIDKGDSYGSDN